MGETLSLDSGRVLLTLLEKSGQRAKLALVAPKEVTWTKGRRASVDLETIKQGLTPHK